MSEPIKKKNTYVGSYGAFLDTINKPDSPLEPVILEALKQHNGQMLLKDLIISLDAKPFALINTLKTLQNQHIIDIKPQDNDELVEVVVGL